jgi:S-methyl-5-thioribose-1-phosphate isomerase
MKVRGAPAIAIAAALSLARELRASATVPASGTDAAAHVGARLALLATSRPTAVNLFEATARLTALAKEQAAQGGDGARVYDAVASACEAMLAEDVAANEAMGRYGAEAVRKHAKAGVALTLLTHCNTGALATAGFGTALGIIRALYAQEKEKKDHGMHVYCTETRPYMQGARLTAYELVYEKIPSTLITDSMGAALMQRKGLSAVVVGADRVANDGSTANKIGTYALAIAARHHGVPFFVAAPTTTLDCGLASGAAIHIEERPADELTHWAGARVAADGIGVWNPSFDVTPPELITAIVTERGLIYPPYDLATWLAAHPAPK